MISIVLPLIFKKSKKSISFPLSTPIVITCISTSFSSDVSIPLFQYKFTNDFPSCNPTYNVLISAFVHSPKLLVLDEPFVGLDPKASFVIKNLMKEFVKSGGAIFFSTHVLEVAEKLCNKVAIIKNGEIIKCGTMAEIKQDKSLENAFLESENE